MQRIEALYRLYGRPARKAETYVPKRGGGGGAIASGTRVPRVSRFREEFGEEFETYVPTGQIPEVKMSRISLRNLSAFLAFFVATFIFFIHLKPRHDHLSPNEGNGHPQAANPAVPLSLFDQDSPSPISHSPNHTHIYPKRALSQEYQCLVQKGQQYWEQGVLPAFDGQSRFPAPNFGAAEDILQDSGWTMTDAPKPLPSYWTPVMKATKYKIPKSGAPVRRIELNQNRDFENDYGEQQTATSGRYEGLFIPGNNFVIMDLTWSPRFRVSTSTRGQGIKEEDLHKYVPRMTQLSDLVWHAWSIVKQNQNLGSLRYYGVEGVTNAVAKPLILDIFRARRGGKTDVTWKKRITFDMGSDEGKALLGSPTGIAVAWLLIHHAGVLGRRE
ncbi:MAG: hypothetical protein Q9216_006228, partial [Gyalolechia sp. 2 TL-2023]